MHKLPAAPHLWDGIGFCWMPAAVLSSSLVRSCRHGLGDCDLVGDQNLSKLYIHCSYYYRLSVQVCTHLQYISGMTLGIVKVCPDGQVEFQSFLPKSNFCWPPTPNNSSGNFIDSNTSSMMSTKKTSRKFVYM